MTAVTGESPLDLQPVLAVLESRSSSGEQILEAYTKLAGHLTVGELSIFERDIVERGKRLVAATKKHAKGSGGILDSVAQKALCVMGYCLNDKDIVSLLSDEEAAELMSLLSEIITESTEKNTCSHALWCLSRQSLGSSIITEALPSLLAAIGKAASKWWKVSVVVEHEGLVAINRLCEQCHQTMEEKCVEWGALLLRLIVSAAPKVRSQAFEIAQKWASAFAGNSDCMRVAASALKEHIKPELQAMFKNGMEMYVLKVCTFLLSLFKKQLHHRGTINCLLSIMELAFRVTSPEIRIAAFRWWKTLIDVFDETNSLTNTKLVALVMRPFTTLNTPTEAVAMEKLVTWWHYVRCLDSVVWHHFDQVLKPLLQFCLGSTHLGSMQPGSALSTPGQLNRPAQDGTSPAFRRSIGGADTTPNMPSFPRVQKCGLEVLAHLMRDASKPVSPAIKFALDPLNPDVTISVGVFLKNASILISALFEFTKILIKTTPEAQMMHVWQCMTSHLRLALDTSRMERHEALSSFLTQFRDLVVNQVFSTHLTLRVFQFVSSFPDKVLSSTAFGMNGNEVTKGCPAQFLVELMLSLNLKDIDRQESFMTVFATMVRCGTFHPSGVLEFCQLVGQLLDKHAESMSSAEVLWRLWSVLANTLQEHISKTNEVNQGDSLEYSFECMYTVLLLPISQRLGARVAQAVHRTALKTWCLLYKTFARLSALVSNAQANVALEEFSHKVLNTVKADSYTKDLATLDYLLEMCLTMVDTVDFSALTTTNPFMQGLSLSASPNPIRGRHHHHSRPLGHLHSFVKLLSMLVQWVKERLEAEEKGGEREDKVQEEKRSSADNHLQAACTSVVSTVSVLVTHLTVSSVISHMIEQLACPLAAVFHVSSSKKNVARLYQSPVFKQQLERLWQEICTMLRQRYKGPYDNELLAHLSPLLTATFQHSRRQVKADTVQLWNATFGQSSPPLSYPADLLPVLSKVKEKTQLSLPGWVNVDIGVIEETPLSQMSQLDSQVPEPVIPGIPSPHRHGSFLNKDVSPRRSPSSPATKRIVHRSENRLFGSNPRKKLAVDFMSEKDFVVIKEAPKKRHILTEHQKEILAEKRVLPAMYNNLDASQDRSLMSHFSSGDTQQDSIVHSPISDVIVVNSSQSQDLQPLGVVVSANSQANNQTSSDPFLAPRRSSRRRSVRFDDSEQESRDSESSITAGSKKSQGSINMAPAVETVEKLTISSKSSSEDSMREANKSGNVPAPQPEVVSISSEHSSSEEKRCERAEEENDPFFRPFKSLSQTLPRTKSGGFETNSHDNATLLLRRKTRSQELVTTSDNSANDAEAISKSRPGGIPTTLEKWLKKPGDVEKPLLESPAVSTVATETSVLKLVGVVQKITPPRSDGATLVEETQSPKKFAEEMSSSANISIQETPTKTSLEGSSPEEEPSARISNLSMSLKEASNTPVSVGNRDACSSFSLKEPLVQLERLAPAATEMLARPPVSTPTSSKEKSSMPFCWEESPPDLCTGSASQGFSPEPDVLLSENPVPSQQPEVAVVEDSSASDGASLFGSLRLQKQAAASERRVVSSSEDSISLNHQTLFGFSELLKDVEGNASADSDLKSTEEERSTKQGESSCENLPSDPGSYNPHLISTIRTTPPRLRPRPDSQESEASSAASCSQKSTSSGSISESSQNPSQQDPPEADLEFDPSKEATLQDKSSEHSKRRKQSLPKKIADPQLLRRTPRRMKIKKAVCPCCKDKEGASTHHHPHTPLPARQKRKHIGEDSSATPLKELSPIRKKVRRPLSQGAASSSPKHPLVEKGRRSLSQGSITNGGPPEPLAGQKSKKSSVGKKDHEADESNQTKTALDYESLGSEKPVVQPIDLSPQDIGEKTPETKTSCTPLRQSTTKRKMEVAKRRSLSLPASRDSRKPTAGSSESDSDDLPLSQTVAKQQKEGLPSKTSIASSSSSLALRDKVGDSSNQVVTVGSCVEEKRAEESTSSVVGKKNDSSGKEEGPSRKTSPVLKTLSPRLTSPKRGVSRLQLKRLGKHKVSTLRSPPKLRLRQRKAEASSQETENRLGRSQTPQTNVEKAAKINKLEIHLVPIDSESSSTGLTKLKNSQEVVGDKEKDIITVYPSQDAAELISDASSMEIVSCQSKEDQSAVGVVEKESQVGGKSTGCESLSLQTTEKMSAKRNAKKEVRGSESKTKISYGRFRSARLSRNLLSLRTPIGRRQQQRTAFMRSRKRVIFLRHEKPRKQPPVTRSAAAKAKGIEMDKEEEFESSHLSLDSVGLENTSADAEIVSEDKAVKDTKPFPGSTSATSSEKECGLGIQAVTLQEEKGHGAGMTDNEVCSEVELTTLEEDTEGRMKLINLENTRNVTETVDVTQDPCSVMVEGSEDIFADSCSCAAQDAQVQQKSSSCVEEEVHAHEGQEEALDGCASSSKDSAEKEGTNTEVSSEVDSSVKLLPSNDVAHQGDLDAEGSDDLSVVGSDLKDSDDQESLGGVQAELDQEGEMEVEERDDTCTEDSSDRFFPHNQAGLQDPEVEELPPPVMEKYTCFSDSVDEKEETASDAATLSSVGTVDPENALEASGSADLQHVAMQTSPDTHSNHAAIQTSPEKLSSTQQPRRKMSKKEILDAIAESDVTPAEIIAALQVKTSRARRLFAACSSNPTRLQGHLQGRGLAMLKQSIQLQKEQQKAGGYLAGRLGGQTLGRSTSGRSPSSPSKVPPIIISSPSASPTGSILKRRGVTPSPALTTLEEEEVVVVATESTPEAPQTPTPVKKRRVSFAEPVISGESPAHEATLSKSPNYFKKDSPSKSSEPTGLKFVEFCPQKELSKALNRQAVRRRVLDKIRTANLEVALPVSPSQPATSQQSQSSSSLQTPEQATPSQPTQNSYQSTQESQLDATKPIFPELVDCTKPVGLILPQLTSSLWHRGLCQLMKARGVDSVGDLAKLTEVEVHGMPVRAPKVENVRTVLAAFHAQHYAKASSSAASTQPSDCDNQNREKSATETEGDNSETSQEGKDSV